MFFFDSFMIIPFIMGIFWLLFSRWLGNLQIKKYPNSFLSIPIINEIFIVWTGRVVGVATIIIALYSCTFPDTSIMRKDENVIMLLEKGKIIEGEVIKSWYSEDAPLGWKLMYQFKAKKPETQEEKTYYSMVWGPKPYYADLPKGDTIDVIYYSKNPKINCEIRYFLNYPGYRHTFKEAGKLYLLDKFRDEYEVKNYGYILWYDLQSQK